MSCYRAWNEGIKDSELMPRVSLQIIRFYSSMQVLPLAPVSSFLVIAFNAGLRGDPFEHMLSRLS